MPIIRQTVKPDSIVYTDCFSAYDKLDVSGFHHVRINHSEKSVEAKNHIGIEKLRMLLFILMNALPFAALRVCNQSKRHLRRYNGIPKQHFHLFLKECEWRFNYRPAINLLKTLLAWAIQ